MSLRIRTANDVSVNETKDAVVYWMIGARRAQWSFALDHALSLARTLCKPLVVLEPLRCDYAWASDRHHAFVIDGMRDNARAFASAGIAYHPYIEPVQGAGRGLLAAYAKHAAVVVTDEALGFFQPRMIARAAVVLGGLDVRLDVVDSNGLLPIRALSRTYPTAYIFRRAMQRALPEHLAAFPEQTPLVARTARKGAHDVARGFQIPAEILARWPATTDVDLKTLPIDHAVKPTLTGGAVTGTARVRALVDDVLARYDRRSHPDAGAASGLSPWLHFGHVSVHEVCAAVMAREDWSPDKAGGVCDGNKRGFWGMSENAEAFLDELVTWRELAHNAAALDPLFDNYEGIPSWARRTLAVHGADVRAPLYTRDELEGARTADPVWNAAQRELVSDGVMQNYLRMLWGKKVIEWSQTPQQAFATLVELNNKYALDGRDPNSYAGIAWCFGRYDRPWAPERPVFGQVRFMSSTNTVKKLKAKQYLQRHSGLP